jgi:stage V sporulation protein G
MRITEIRMYRCGEPRLKATVTVTLEDAFVVKGIKVILGRQGLFLAMPSRRKDDGTYEDICHPINRETREYFETVILGEYHRLEGDDDHGPRPSPPYRPEGDAYGDSAHVTP